MARRIGLSDVAVKVRSVRKDDESEWRLSPLCRYFENDLLDVSNPAWRSCWIFGRQVQFHKHDQRMFWCLSAALKSKSRTPGRIDAMSNSPRS